MLQIVGVAFLPAATQRIAAEDSAKISDKTVTAADVEEFVLLQTHANLVNAWRT